jgi:hypothetical protein
MLKNFCHDQVKILLERMDTHPEEFIKERKWDEFLPVEASPHRGLVSCKFKHFNKIEQYLIKLKYEKMVKSALRQNAYDSILETLVFKEESNYFSTTVGALQPYTTTLNASTHTHIETHADYLRRTLAELERAAK